MAASPANLEIYRTDSYKSKTATTLARALGNFCPVKIFSLGRRASVVWEEEEEKKRGRKDESGPERDRDVDALRSRRRKVDGLEFAQARFMDYRPGVRDLSDKPNAKSSKRDFEEKKKKKKKTESEPGGRSFDARGMKKT